MDPLAIKLRPTPAFTGPMRRATQRRNGESMDGKDSDSGLKDIPNSEDPDQDGAGTALHDMPSIIWNPMLPRVPCPGVLVDGGAYGSGKFELRKLVGAIQAGEANASRVFDYMGAYTEKVLNDKLNAKIQSYPAIFYIVETNEVQMIRDWIRFGGDPNVVGGENKLPLLAFAILHSAETLYAATRTVEVLLEFGASPKAIPDDFYIPYNRDINGDMNLDEIDTSGSPWCTEAIKTKLAKALNLTQRYRLNQTSRINTLSAREIQIARRYKSDGLLRIRHAIIAQDIATEHLAKRLLSYLAMPRSKPLVLVFAGPSGHGKTELAKKFGEFLSHEIATINCATYDHERELWGGRAPWVGSDSGSPLNNFLRRNSGQRSIVFLDEFEKTSKAIHNSFLILWDEGRYEDRRYQSEVDCSKTIWVIATNEFDARIHGFCRQHERVLLHNHGERAQTDLIKSLCSQLRADAKAAFGSPITGRISEILPFLPFSDDEAAIVTHKFCMDLEANVMRPIVLCSVPSESNDNLVGNCRLLLPRDAKVCSNIAKEHYDHDTGARSIFNGIEHAIKYPLVGEYLADREEIHEEQSTTTVLIDVDADDEVMVRVLGKN